MDFISGALPNVMFIAGLIAIGLALGLEFKIVEIKGDLSKGGRISAFGVGIILIAASIVLYTRSTTPQTVASVPTSVPPTAAQIQLGLVEQVQIPTAALPPTAQPSPLPTTTAPSPAATELAPTAPPSPVPTATELPTVQPSPLPTATAVIADPVADFRVLLTAAIADGRVSRNGADILKSLDELQAMLTKGDQKRATDRLHALQKSLQDGVKKRTIDATFAQQSTVAIQRIADYYHL